jgi:hypothetical protein
LACKETEITRTTHYEWYKTDEEYRQAVDGMEDIVLDFAESKLHGNINKGKETSTIFYLKTKGKKRGYVEKTEIENSIDPEFAELIRELRVFDDTNTKQNKPRKAVKAKKQVVKKIPQS